MKTFKNYNELSANVREIIDFCKSETNAETMYKVLDNTISLQSAEKNVGKYLGDLDNVSKWDSKSQTEFIKNLAKCVALRHTSISGCIKDIYCQLTNEEWYALTGCARTIENRNEIIAKNKQRIATLLHCGEIYRHTLTFNCFIWDNGKDKAGNLKIVKGVPADLEERGIDWAKKHRQDITIDCENYEAEAKEHKYICPSNVVKYTEYKKVANAAGVMRILFAEREGIKPVCTSPIVPAPSKKSDKSVK